MAKEVPGRFSLERFTRHDFYLEVNQRLVELAALRPGLRVIDLGAGTGAVTKLLLQKVSGSTGAEIYAVDPSPSALESARRNLRQLNDAVIRFVQGGAEKVSQIVNRPVDAVFFCNAVHLVPAKDEVFKEVSRSLRHDGTFSFNTTFYEGAEPPETDQFYNRWMMKAVRKLKRDYGRTPSRDKALARDRLSKDDYLRLLREAGFEIDRCEVMQVEFDLESFQDISEYSLWIEGILPGVPLEEGSAVLKETVRETYEELGLKTSPRNWLLVVAKKP